MLNNGQKIKLRVVSAEWNHTLADYLARHQDWFRHIDLEDAVSSGQFQVNGHALSFQDTLGPQPVVFVRPPWEEPPAPDTIHVIFRDQDLLVVDKPAGIPITPSGAYLEHSLLHLLRTRLQLPDVSPVHRLDLETSGVCAFAVRPAVRGHFQKQFQDQSVHKEYHALVWGQLDADLQEIRHPLARHDQIHTRWVPHPTGLTAHTRIEKLTHRGSFSEVVVQPITGRTNQIRAHLAGVGHPIVGDKKYHQDPGVFFRWLEERSFSALQAQLLLPRQALHCATMTLRNIGGEERVLHSDVAVFEQWRDKLGL